MNNKLKLLLASAAICGLAACGGGGGGSSAPVSTTTSVPVTVVDGAIGNATVCLDMNSNGACDAGEPSGKTDASGNVNLQVPNTDVGKYTILAIVGTDAVDADHGPVTVPFTMSAPADQPAVVSPLTTLVQTFIESTGASTADAEASVKLQTGLNVSLFQDFTKSTTPESQAAGTVARMVVVVTQQQNNIISGEAGSTALDGTTISKANLDAAVQKKLLELLPSLLEALSDPSVTGAADAAAKEAALLAKATTIIGSEGLTTSSVATVVAINNQASSTTPPVAETPAAGATLANINFTNISNWFVRAFAATAAQATPDASGLTRYVERRARNVSGATQRWNTGSDPHRQSDLHFNGTSWVTCGFNQEGINTPRNSGGNGTYVYCDNLESGKQTRATFDIAGKTMIEIYQQVRDAGYTNMAISSASSVLGTATFPANSKLLYQSNASLVTAPAYYPGTGNIAFQSNADVAAGKTSAADTTSACALISAGTPSSTYQTRATTLEALVTATPGTPCVYNPGTTVVNTGFGTATVASGARNDWWGATSQSVGILGNAQTGGTQTAYYTTNTLLRVAFSGSTAKYYTCQQRSTDGSPRNCDLVGTGTYTISTVGDARTLTLGNQPVQFSAINYQRVFVERGGRIYLGYQSRTAIGNSARLNLPALNALFTKLGLSTLNVDTPLALTTTSYAGEWRVSQNGDESTGYTTIRIFNDGSPTTCTWNDPDGSSGSETCTLSITPATGAVTVVFEDGTFTGTFNFMTGGVSGTFTPDVGSAESILGARR